FSPLFFVWLGASLHVRELGENPKLMLLGLGLGGAAVLAHMVGRLFGQPLSLGALAAAQLGVPIAAAAIGEQQQSLIHGEAAALILGALVTVVAATLGGALYAKTAARHQPGVAKPEGPLGDSEGSGAADAAGGGPGGPAQSTGGTGNGVAG
ncbi:MAG: cation:proton antiporter, partial [Mycobacterium sp.]